jgi:DNA-directed RNA polymerase specialized sigma24 family protein
MDLREPLIPEYLRSASFEMAANGSNTALDRTEHLELVRDIQNLVGNWEDTCLLVASTYIHYAEARDSIAPEEVRGYLFRTGRFLARQWVSAQDRGAGTHAREGEPACASWDWLCPDGLQGNLDRETLLERIDDLPKKIRDALLFVRHQKLTFEEAGRRLNVHPEEVCLLIARALEYLMDTIPMTETGPPRSH